MGIKEKMDYNHDGKVNFDDLKDWVKDKLDVNKDNKINLDDAIALIKKKLDTDGSGQVDPIELKDAIGVIVDTLAG